MLGTFLATRRHNLTEAERYLWPTPCKARLVDAAADAAHLVSIMRQRILARGPGSPTSDATPGEQGLFYDMQDMADLQGLLFDSTQSQTMEPAAPLTPATVR